MPVLSFEIFRQVSLDEDRQRNYTQASVTLCLSKQTLCGFKSFSTRLADELVLRVCETFCDTFIE